MVKDFNTQSGAKMELKTIVSSLSDIEKQAMKAMQLQDFKAPEQIAKESGLQIDSVRRALGWLAEKKLIETREQKEKALKLSQMGKSSLSKGLPERMFIRAIADKGGKASLQEVQKKSELNTPELNAAMGLAKHNAWVSIQKNAAGIALELTGLEKDLLEGKYPLELMLKKINAAQQISDGEKGALAELQKRGLVEESERSIYSARLNDTGKQALGMLSEVKQRAFNIEGRVPEIFIGKKQPYMQFLLQVRRKLTELGFIEMESPLITQEFYNFDALFQPQDHPARFGSDSYQLKQPKFGKLPQKEIVARVKAAHENGGKTGSKGWQYSWSEEIAKRLMPAAHCTAHSARQLVKGVKVPGKYFAVARVYRPDVMDATHLIEFNQMEGIIIDEQMNFRKLLGMLKQFAIEFAGAEEVKFVPSYFPFTEPSCQLNAKHPELGWVELGGSGIFRPELTKPLGIEQPVLAWGIGIDRIAMFKLGINDIRQLFSTDLNWLRQQKMVLVD